LEGGAADIAAACRQGLLQNAEMPKNSHGHHPGGIGIFAAEYNDVDADRTGQQGQYAKHFVILGLAS
jgi:hypothetical protein